MRVSCFVDAIDFKISLRVYRIPPIRIFGLLPSDALSCIYLCFYLCDAHQLY
jgi:hypothetical protein